MPRQRGLLSTFKQVEAPGQTQDTDNRFTRTLPDNWELAVTVNIMLIRLNVMGWSMQSSDVSPTENLWLECLLSWSNDTKHIKTLCGNKLWIIPSQLVIPKHTKYFSRNYRRYKRTIPVLFDLSSFVNVSYITFNLDLRVPLSCPLFKPLELSGWCQGQKVVGAQWTCCLAGESAAVNNETRVIKDER